MIDLPIPKDNKSPTLIDCLDEYYKPERLDGDNAYLNEKTNKKEDVDKGIVVWSFPNVLVISLKRFNNSVRKDQRLVTFDLENMNLSKYVKGYDKNSYVYVL